MSFELTADQEFALTRFHQFIDAPTNYMSLMGYAGSGKEQPIDAIIKTPNGDKLMGDLREGDTILARNGRTTNVTRIFPQGEKQAYKVTFRDGTSTECGIDHLWEVQTPKLRKLGTSRVMSLRDIITTGLKFKSGNYRFQIPLCDPVNYSEKEYTIDPYILGCLIGDGTDLGKTPTLCNPEYEIINHIKPLIPNYITLVEDNSSNCMRHRFTDKNNKSNRFTEQFRKYNLNVKSINRFIPNDYLHGSVDQRLELLKGLMDTDGTSRNNRISFSTMSEQLAKDVRTLVQSLGGVGIIRSCNRGSKGVEYSVNVKMFFNPFKFSDKAKNWKYSKKNPPSRYIIDITPTRMVEQQCIMVDSEEQLYLTDNFIVTHNTTLVNYILERYSNPSRVVITAPTHKAVKVLRDKTESHLYGDIRTIHSLLGLKLVKRFGQEVLEQDGTVASQVDKFDLIIVDECSMVGQELFEFIQEETLGTDTKVLFVGDPLQLPPINESISQTFEVPEYKAKLSQVVRQAMDNPIIALTVQIRNAIKKRDEDLIDFKTALNNNHGIIHYKSKKSFRNAAIEFLTHNQTIDAGKVISWRNKSVKSYNMAIREALFDGEPERDFMIGEKVSINESLFLGGITIPRDTEGEIVEIEDIEVDKFTMITRGNLKAYAVKIYIPSLDTFVNLKALNSESDKQYNDACRYLAGAKNWAVFWKLKEEFADLRHVHSITSHKSQGSTYTQAFVNAEDILANPNTEEALKCLYVAVSRASDTAHIYYRI